MKQFLVAGFIALALTSNPASAQVAPGVQCGSLPGVTVDISPINPQPGELITATIFNNSGQTITTNNGCAIKAVVPGVDACGGGTPVFPIACSLILPIIPSGSTYSGVWDQTDAFLGQPVPPGPYSFLFTYSDATTNYSCCLNVDIGTVDPGTSSCFGDGGDQAGCTPCPCGNEAAVDSGSGCINSSGGGATLVGLGSTSVTAPEPTDLGFQMTGSVPASTAVLFSGGAIAPQNPANPCFGMESGVTSTNLDGLRCAVFGVLRHGVRAVSNNGDVGFATNGWGGPFGPPAGIAGAAGFTAGMTRHFQVFYRDLPAVVCATEQNSTQAVSITFTP